MVKGKGLKGALARHVINEAHKKKITQKAAAAKAQKDSKLKSIKGGKPSKKVSVQQHKPFIPFTTEDKILLVGEGDFSFARSIIEEGQTTGINVVATSYDSKDVLAQKYPNAISNMEFLRKNGCDVRCNIDATKLVETLKIKKDTTHRSIPQINTIIFNFPHTGHGVKDQDRNIREHQILLTGFFHSSEKLFQSIARIYNKDLQLAGYFSGTDSTSCRKSPNSVTISLFNGEPYQSWNIKSLAKSEKFLLERSAQFVWGSFPAYHHRRTNSTRDTTKPAEERDARFYKFTKDGSPKKVAAKPDLDSE